MSPLKFSKITKWDLQNSQYNLCSKEKIIKVLWMNILQNNQYLNKSNYWTLPLHEGTLPFKFKTLLLA